MPSRPCSGRGLVGVGRVPLRSAYRGEQDRVGGAGLRERALGQGRSRGVDGAAAQQRLVEHELDVLGRADAAQDLDRLGHDLGTDAVSGKQTDAVRDAHGSPS